MNAAEVILLSSVWFVAGLLAAPVLYRVLLAWIGRRKRRRAEAVAAWRDERRRHADAIAGQGWPSPPPATRPGVVVPLRPGGDDAA